MSADASTVAWWAMNIFGASSQPTCDDYPGCSTSCHRCTALGHATGSLHSILHAVEDDGRLLARIEAFVDAQDELNDEWSWSDGIRGAASASSSVWVTASGGVRIDGTAPASVVMAVVGRYGSTP